MSERYSRLQDLDSFFQTVVSDALLSSEAPEPTYPPGPRPKVSLIKFNPQLNRRHGTNILSSLSTLKNTHWLDPLKLGEYFPDAAAARRRLEDFAFVRGFAIVRVNGLGDLHDDHPETYPRCQPPYTVYRCVHYQGEVEEGCLDSSETEHVTIRYGVDCKEYAGFGCGWSTMVKYDRYRGVWYLKPAPYTHSHPMISNPFDYPQHEHRHPKYLDQKPPPSDCHEDNLDLNKLFSALSHNEIRHMIKSAVGKSVSKWQKINKRKAMKTSILDLPNEILLKIADYICPLVRERLSLRCILRFHNSRHILSSSLDNLPEYMEPAERVRKADELKPLIFTNRFFARLLIPEFRKRVQDTVDKTPNFLWTIKNGHRTLCFLGLVDPEITPFERNVNYCTDFCDGSHGKQRLRICKGGTALHYATKYGAANIVKKLVYYGAIVNMMNCCGQTPLCIAASRADKRMVELLLELGANPYVSQQNAEPAASWAVRSKLGRRSDIRIVMELLDKRDTTAAEKSIFRIRKLSLHRAAANGHEAIILMLTKSPVDIDISSRSPEGYTALHIAVHNGKFNISRTLLAAGADCSVVDNDGNRPLNYAAMNGDVQMMALLLANGAKVNDGNGNVTALHFAALYGHLDVVRSLVDVWGADINVRDRDGTLPLTYARFANQEAAVRLLLRRGAENQTMGEGRPLMKSLRKIAKRASRCILRQPAHLISVHQFFPEHKFIEFIRR